MTNLGVASSPGLHGDPAWGPWPARLVARAFQAAAAARQARAFHPRGACEAATFVVEAGSRAFARVPGERPAIVRRSRGAGLPEALPDILGLAIRLEVDPPGRPVDVLLASAGRGRWGRHTLRVHRGLGRRGWYSSIARYRVADGGPPLVLGAETGVDGTVDLYEADGGGPWRRIGRLRTSDDHRADCEVRFDPWATPPGLTIEDPFGRLRRAAYRGSRAGAP